MKSAVCRADVAFRVVRMGRTPDNLKGSNFLRREREFALLPLLPCCPLVSIHPKDREHHPGRKMGPGYDIS